MAGAMTGQPEGGFPAFRSAAADLREQGYRITSPVEMNESDGLDAVATPGHPRRGEFLTRDLLVVLDPDIDGVIVLPGWESSAGAQIEVGVAEAVGKPVWRYPELLPLRPAPLRESVPAESVLAEAERLVGGDRASDYGHPAEHSAKVAGLWREAFGWDTDAVSVNLAMMLFKLARAAATPTRDSLVDVAGYARTAEATLARQGTEGFRDLGPA